MSDPETPPSPDSSDADINQASAAQSATWASKCAVASEEAAALARRYAGEAGNAVSSVLGVSTDAGNVLVDGSDSKALLRLDPRPDNMLAGDAEGLYAVALPGKSTLNVIWGQSNAEGVHDGGPNPASELVFVWNPDTGTWGSSDYTQPPFSLPPPAGNNGNNNVGLAYVHRVADETQASTFLVYDAQGGKPLSDWVPQSAVRYAALKAKIETALASPELQALGITTVSAVIGLQGEADSFTTDANPLPSWAPSTPHVAGDEVNSTSLGAVCWICVGAGTTGAVEPVWAGNGADVIVDGSCYWVQAGGVNADGCAERAESFTTYLAEFSTLIDQFMAESWVDENTAFLIAGMSGLHDRYEPTWAQQYYCTNDNSRVVFVSAAGLQTEYDATGSGDYTHWLGPSLWEFGYERMWVAANQRISLSRSGISLFYGRGVGEATAAAAPGTLITRFSSLLSIDSSVQGAQPNGVASTGSITWGRNCAAAGNNSYAFGYACTTANLTNYTLVAGREIHALSGADFSAGFGFQNVLNTTYAFASGRGHIVADSGQSASGLFSLYTTPQTPAVMEQHGVGTTSSARKNSRTVLADGTTIFSGNHNSDPMQAKEITFEYQDDHTIRFKLRTADGKTINFGPVLMLKTIPFVTPQMYGALVDGATDDAADFLLALNSGFPVKHVCGILAISSVICNVACDIEVSPGASIRLLNNNSSTPGITLNGPNSRIVAWGLIDGNLAGRTAVALGTLSGPTADYSVAWLYNVQNVSGETWSGTHPSGIEINGGTGQKFYINARNFPNNLAGQTGSPARAATVEGYADKVVGAVDADNVWVGAVLATTTCELTRVRVTNSGLEAVYNLNGDNTVGDIYYAGQYQALVNEANIHVDRIVHTGGNPPTGAAVAANGGATIAVQSAGITEVGLVQVERNPALPVAGPGTLVQVRSGSAQSGPVRVGAVQGIIRPVKIIALGFTGLLQELDVQNVDVICEYDAGVMTDITEFVDITTCQEFLLRNWKVKVVDVNNGFVNLSSYFKVTLPGTNLVRPSFIEDVRFYLYEQDGVTLAPTSQFPNVRIYGGSSPLISSKGMAWEAGIACMREANAFGVLGGEDVANTMPTAGGPWHQGKYLRNASPVETGTAGSKYVVRGWTCVAAGTPGTWVQDRALTGN
ncbi:hypothetical protein [Paraburkholderia adhaesiva]|uniref:hypothetical protein n=1 Tax=Paraburkholderia adhaesiva TaxID=2883244 RepID=UPI001F2AEA29|nr:hypothetical protein [Paraburkholderia adhaesiva]